LDRPILAEAEVPTRQIVYGNYRIFYDAQEGVDEVKILHVRHGARDEPRLGWGGLR
jgi:plasmid stabilization system protein ParE